MHSVVPKARQGYGHASPPPGEGSSLNVPQSSCLVQTLLWLISCLSWWSQINKCSSFAPTRLQSLGAILIYECRENCPLGFSYPCHQQILWTALAWCRLPVRDHPPLSRLRKLQGIQWPALHPRVGCPVRPLGRKETIICILKKKSITKSNIL